MRVSKVTWQGKIIAVQPRIQLPRSFDERRHAYLAPLFRRSPLTAYRSPLTVHRSPFTAHGSRLPQSVSYLASAEFLDSREDPRGPNATIIPALSC